MKNGSAADGENVAVVRTFGSRWQAGSGEEALSVRERTGAVLGLVINALAVVGAVGKAAVGKANDIWR